MKSRSVFLLIGVLLLGFVLPDCVKGSVSSDYEPGRIFIIDNTRPSPPGSETYVTRTWVEYEGTFYYLDTGLPRNMNFDGTCNHLEPIQLTEDPLPGGTVVTITYWFDHANSTVEHRDITFIIDGDITVELYMEDWDDWMSVVSARVHKGKWSGPDISLCSGRIFIIDNTRPSPPGNGTYVTKTWIEYEGMFYYSDTGLPRNMNFDGTCNHLEPIQLTEDPLPCGTEVKITYWFDHANSTVGHRDIEFTVDGDITVELYMEDWNNWMSVVSARIHKGKWSGPDIALCPGRIYVIDNTRPPLHNSEECVVKTWIEYNGLFYYLDTGLPRNMNYDGTCNYLEPVELTEEPLPGGTEVTVTYWFDHQNSTVEHRDITFTIAGDITVELYMVDWNITGYGSMVSARVHKGKWSGPDPAVCPLTVKATSWGAVKSNFR